MSIQSLKVWVCAGLSSLSLVAMAATGPLYVGRFAGDGGGLTNLPIASTNGGTVTSVGLSAPSQFGVNGTPVMAAGTLNFTNNYQAQNTFWAGPTSGANAGPTFRLLVVGDIPSGLNVLGATNFWGQIAQSNITIAVLTNNTSGNASGSTNFYGMLNSSNLPPVMTNNTTGNAKGATNFWGQLSPTNFNGGVGASSSTVLAGDGTWQTKSVGTGSSNITDSAYTAVIRNATIQSNLTINGTGPSYLTGGVVAVTGAFTGDGSGLTNIAGLVGPQYLTNGDTRGFAGTTTNLVNRGQAISSIGSLPWTEQFGSNATAGFQNSAAIGVNATTSDTNQITIGGLNGGVYPTLVVPGKATISNDVTVYGNLVVLGTNANSSVSNLAVGGSMTMASTETNSSLVGPGLITADITGGRSVATVGSGLLLSAGVLSATGAPGTGSSNITDSAYVADVRNLQVETNAVFKGPVNINGTGPNYFTGGVVAVSGSITNLSGRYVQSNTVTSSYYQIGTNAHQTSWDQNGVQRITDTNGYRATIGPSTNLFSNVESNGNYTASGKIQATNGFDIPFGSGSFSGLLSSGAVTNASGSRVAYLTDTVGGGASGVATNGGTGVGNLFSNVTFRGMSSTNGATLDSLMVTNNLTNLSLTASQFVASDASRILVSTINGWAWTNLQAKSIVSTTNATPNGVNVDFSILESTTNAAGNIAFTTISNWNPTNYNRAIVHVMANGSDRTITFGTGWKTQGSCVATNGTQKDLLFECQIGWFTNVSWKSTY